jgi:hypothetical protein
VTGEATGSQAARDLGVAAVETTSGVAQGVRGDLRAAATRDANILERGEEQGEGVGARAE